MAENWGLIGSGAATIREALTSYQTVKNQKRQERMLGLLQGVQENPETGEVGFTPQEKLKRDAQYAEYDPQSQESQTVRSLLSQQGGVEVPENLSAAQGFKYKDLYKKKGASEEQLKSASELRKEYQGRPLVKEFNTINSAYQKVQSAAQNPSAAGDLSLIFGYMKLLDPQSTVREGEFATAQNSGSVPTKVQSYYNKIMSGERLTPEQRQDFVNQANGVAKVHAKQLKDVEDEFGDLSSKYGVDSGLIYKPQSGGLLGSKSPQFTKKQQKKKKPIGEMTEAEIDAELGE